MCLLIWGKYADTNRRKFFLLLFSPTHQLLAFFWVVVFFIFRGQVFVKNETKFKWDQFIFHKTNIFKINISYVFFLLQILSKGMDNWLKLNKIVSLNLLNVFRETWNKNYVGQNFNLLELVYGYFLNPKKKKQRTNQMHMSFCYN